MTSAEHTGRATGRARRSLVVSLLACIALCSVLAGTTIGVEAATTNPRPAEMPAPFAQADDETESDDDDSDEDDEGTRVINITAPGEDVEYTLTAPGLEPTANLETAANQEDPDTVQETISGDTATGLIGNDKYDSYRFTGSVDEVRLESEGIEKIEVRIDGEPVDPRTLTGEETETTSTTTATETTTQETATETETATATTGTPATTTDGRETTQSTSTDTASTDTSASDASTTTGAPNGTATTASGGQSGQSGFGIAMFVLIGIVSGLVLAASLVYVVGSDRFG